MSFGWEVSESVPDLPTVWADRRKVGKREIFVGHMGTIGDTVGGDLVCVEMGGAYLWASIAWKYPSGNRSAHMYNPETGEIDLSSAFVKILREGLPCRFLGIRPK